MCDVLSAPLPLKRCATSIALSSDGSDDDPEPECPPAEDHSHAGRYFGFTLHRPVEPVLDDEALDPNVKPISHYCDDQREPPYESCTVGDYHWMLDFCEQLESLKTKRGKKRVDWFQGHHEHSSASVASTSARHAPWPHIQGVIRTVSPAPVNTVRKWLQSIDVPGCRGMHVKPYGVSELEHALRYVNDPAYVPGGSHETAKPSSYLFGFGRIPAATSAGTQGKRTDIDEALDLYASGKNLLEVKQAGVSGLALVQTVHVGPKLYSLSQQQLKPKLRYVADIYGPAGSGKTSLVAHLTNPAKTAYIRADSNWMGAITPNITTVVIDEFCGHQPFKALMSMLCGMVPTQMFGKGTEFYAPQVERFIFTSLHGFAYYYTQDNVSHTNGTTAEIEKQVMDRITHTFTPDPINAYKFVCVKNPQARCLNKPEWSDEEHDE